MSTIKGWPSGRHCAGCEAELIAMPIDCPDNKPGCIVSHRRLYCEKCELSGLELLQSIKPQKGGNCECNIVIPGPTTIDPECKIHFKS